MAFANRSGDGAEATDGAGIVAGRQPHPVSRSRAWYVVVMLTLLYIISFVDRVILSLLMTPIATEFGISDARLGLIVGAGFAAVYSICGIPLAYWIDASRRQPIVVGGVMLWSIATTASAFSSNVVELAVWRCGVALGEAVLMPAAVSMIADLFPPHRRSAPIAIFGSIGAIMAGGSWIIGAGAADMATLFVGPGGLAPWRVTLIVVGTPGIVLGIIFMLTVAEPDRGLSQEHGARDAASFAAFLRYLARTWTFFAPLFAGIACFGSYTFGALTWLPTALVRSHGLSYESAGYSAGAMCGGAMIAGAFLWPAIASLLGRRSLGEGPVATLLISGIAAVATMALGPLGGSSMIMLLAASWSMGCLISLSMLPAQTIQLCCPPRMRGKFIAVLLCTNGILGYSAGAYFIPVLGEMAATGAITISHGMAVLGAIVAPLGIVLLAIAFARLRALTRAGLIET